MNHTAQRVVVVGAGTAGGTFAGLLRQAGYDGDVVMLGAEPDPPYHRPPLSKKFADPAADASRWLREAAFYDEQRITLALTESAVDLDPVARVVRTDRGRELRYDVVVLATGARPRPLIAPGAHLDAVLTVRTLSDANRLRDEVAAGRTMAVVGGGFVGLEVAAVARSRGLPVTVVEREERLLARVASPPLARVLAEHHGRRGTVVRTGVEVVAVEGARGRAQRLLLSDNTHVAADVVVVGVGAQPCDELGRRAGLVCAAGGGVVVDDAARTSMDGVLAIGDVTVRPRLGGDPMRMESIPSATEQAKQAVATICGAPPPAPEVPWFWSDQFDLKLKIAGILAPPYDTALRGDPRAGSFALLHHRDGTPVAIETANANADFMAGRRLLASGHLVDAERWADPAVPLRELAFA
ncbi:NAD(P)/FAD-dependent oxidoreductase [Nocardioides sambongensis]|uniref:NAD(P)/FAD-dependent oxidoreductase n=1 Tax=Nocardioides sambongensis TaxID=2589074 RepID=UPI00112BE29E|nr:FAD-dependent oxidoreductase [Nocardioides sambongensis]